MRRTYIDRSAEYYRQMDDELDLMMGSFSVPGRRLRFGEEPISRVEGSGRKKLLVVDDEERIRNLYQRFFFRKGFDVLTAASAVEAKELLVRENVGIVFLDIKMDEVDGGTLFELVRAFHPDVKVIVSSVYPIEEQRKRISEADAYFDKSDGKDILWDLVSVMV